jgi:hypothetical protein
MIKDVYLAPKGYANLGDYIKPMKPFSMGCTGVRAAVFSGKFYRFLVS